VKLDEKLWADVAFCPKCRDWTWHILSEDIGLWYCIECRLRE